jgi:hypothetical protein
MQLQQLVSERQDLGGLRNGGAMPLKPTMAASAVESMRGGRRRRKVEVVGGVMPLATGGGVMLP